MKDAAKTGRGQLRVYLGAAPGVGKTFAMLDEGRRRRERGTDVVIGFVETHHRPKTQAQIRDLEVIPRQKLSYRDAMFEEMDVDAVLARRPRVALVDELAHTNVPGSRNEKRSQDVGDLLAAGIDVITTVNIQHLESLNDVIERITGIRQRETVPDDVVRRADQIELVDMSPEAIRRRMAHGNIYPPERVDAALGNYFRPGNLAALRELALLWLADRVEEGLQGYMETHGIADTWETRERVVTAITGAPGGDQLVRRAARIAGRLRGGLLGVHIASSDGLRADAGAALAEQRRLLEELGGTYREVVGDSVADALVRFARAEKATQVVIGGTRRGRWHELIHGSIANAVVRHAKGFDVHVVAQGDDSDRTETERPPSRVRLRHRRLPTRRVAAAWALAVVVLPALTAVLDAFGDHITLATDLLLLLVAVVAIAVVGGTLVGLVAAVGASLLANWFFVPPEGTLTINDPENVVAIVIFIAAAIGSSVLANRVAERGREARYARAEAAALARTSAILIGQPNPLPMLLDQLRTTFALDAVSLISNRDDGWVIDASAGPDPPSDPFDGDRWDLGRDGTSVLVIRGARLSGDDQRVLQAFLANLAVALESRRLQAEAEVASRLAEADSFRTALLQAVGHDLRTPLASIKASATSLLQSDVDWTAEQRREFAVAIDTAADRLNRLIGNLLDMSRLNAGVVDLVVRPVFLEDVVATALQSIDHDPSAVVVDVPETVPAVAADPPLLERAVANILSNAIAWSPPGAEVTVSAAAIGDRIHLRVVDRGPGVEPADRDRIFRPFQRLGDQTGRAGVGLGLAVARGFVGAIGGSVILDDTPGGGLTVVLDLPRAQPAPAPPITASVPS